MTGVTQAGVKVGFNLETGDRRVQGLESRGHAGKIVVD